MGLFLAVCGVIAGATILLIGYKVLTEGHIKIIEPNQKIMLLEMGLGVVMVLGSIAGAVIFAGML